MLAFAKNGYPLVKTKGDPGYEGSGIVNRYGPLMAVFGQTAADTPGRELRKVHSITVNMVAEIPMRTCSRPPINMPMSF